MNILVTITAPFEAYRKELLNSMKAGKYTDDHLYVICSRYEKDFNTETYEAFASLFDEITMCPFNIAPYDADVTNTAEYANELVGYNYWRIKLEGETLYMPLGSIPTSDQWNKELRKQYRESGKHFLGPIEGEEDEAWMSSYFICDGSFFTTNPCVRAHRKSLMFMYRARNYTKRSSEHSDPGYFKSYVSTPQAAPEPEPEPAPEPEAKPEVRPKKKAAKKKVARKKITKSAIKKAKQKLKKTKASQDTDTK